MDAAGPSSVDVTSVHTRRQWREFLRIAGQINGADPAWIAPLQFERRRQWSARHPWFDHARARAWIAHRDGQAVGCISAQIDDLHERTWGERLGYFGQLEGIDDPAVFQALFDAAGEWLASQGMDIMRGPYDLSVNQACGLLVDGFETPPMLMMGHVQPYYGAHVEAAGMQPAMDLLAYHMAPDFDAPPAMKLVLRRFARRLRVRAVDMRRFDEEIDLIRDIFNDAWSSNWSFVPVTREEFRHMGRDIKPMIRPEYIQIAEIDGEPAAFLVVLPNLNELIRDLDGRLLPFGWARLLWRLWRRKATTARVPLMGVRQAWQGGTLGSALAFSVIEETRHHVHKDGIRDVEMSWILEDNKGMRSILEALGGEVYKRYRIYERRLSDNA